MMKFLMILTLLASCTQPSTNGLANGNCGFNPETGQCECIGSPVIFDLGGDGIQLTTPQEGVRFELSPGHPRKWSWTKPGGSTAWKLATTPRWAAVARKKGAWCHVGRVNTKRRIALCGAAGASSFDGTSVVRFPSTMGRLDRATQRATRQGGLELDDGVVADSDRAWY
jgi:hypothetical protein